MSTQPPLALADAADILSDQLRTHLRRLAGILAPHRDKLHSRFLARLKRLRFDEIERSNLSAITPGAATDFISRGEPPLRFFQQVEATGRGLAKLNLPPSDIVNAIREYDKLLAPVLAKVAPDEAANFLWVREQLNFCIVLTLNNAYYQVRESETDVFYELSRIELESASLDVLFRGFVEAISNHFAAAAGKIYLYDEESGAWALRGATAEAVSANTALSVIAAPSSKDRLRSAFIVYGQSGNASSLLDPGWRGKYASVWSVPLISRGNSAGVMQFAFKERRKWLPREKELVTAAAERCMLMADKQKLVEDLAVREEQIRHLAEHMLEIEEMERRRISRELHDEAGQSLVCIRLQMELIELCIDPENSEIRAKLKETRDLTEKTIVEMRRLIADLSPAILEQLGLPAALRQLINRFRRSYSAKVRLQLGRLTGVPTKLDIVVYRLIQECCNNIAKHSMAENVNISVTSADGVLRLCVEDDGIGFQVNPGPVLRQSFGLAGMQERVALLGGKFELDSNPANRGKNAGKKRGTRVTIELPFKRKENTSGKNTSLSR